jgi:hypothetical protein
MSAGAAPPSTPDGHLSSLPDEKLIVLAHDEHCSPAADTVVLRYYGLAASLAVQWVRWARLGRAETADAKQTAMLALVESASAFDPAHAGPTCCFCTFMWKFVTARLSNFVRDACRPGRRHCRLVIMDDIGDEDCAATDWDRRALVDDGSDPVLILEAREILESLEIVLDGLGPIDRSLWERFASGGRQRFIAREMGVSCRTLKRRRAALLRRVAARLHR